MCLYSYTGALERDAFNYIWVQRTLRQKFRFGAQRRCNGRCCFLKYMYKCITDHNTFALWIRDPLQASQKPLTRIDCFEVNLKMIAESILHAVPFAVA